MHYIFDAAGKPLAEHDGATGAVLREYIWLGDLMVGWSDGTSLHFVHGGHLGQPLAMTDGTSAVVWRAEFGPFGEVLPSVTTAENDLRFPGQWADGETKLLQNWHRDYDPSLGRYIQADPIGLAAGQSLYGYVGGDPVNFVDPMGLDAIGIAFTDQRINGPFGLSSTSLGHAGVLIINDGTGATQYNEFGRYGSNRGNCRRRTVADLVIGRDGMPTASSIEKLLISIRELGRAAGSQHVIINWNFAADDYSSMLSEISNCGSRKSYSALTNNCGHFATDVIEAGGGDWPLGFSGRGAPVPNDRIPAMLGPSFYVGPDVNLTSLANDIRDQYERRN